MAYDNHQKKGESPLLGASQWAEQDSLSRAFYGRTCDLFCVREAQKESIVFTGVHSIYCVHGVNWLGDEIVH
jgi:hypothetical protein